METARRSSSVKETKKSSFTCEQCRKRKVKCDGVEPRCGRCRLRGEDCEYKQSPTLIYTHRLESRVKELEQQLAALQRTATSSRDSKSPPASSTEETPRPAGVAALTRGFKGLDIDDKGSTTYYGSTSFFHLLDDHNHSQARQSQEDESRHPQAEGSQSRQRLVMNAWRQRAQETVAQVPEPFQYLIDFHWCWVQPLFNFIYRPAFTRDMVIMGPYYSHTLMNALLGHSVRWGRSDKKTRDQLKEYEDGAVFSRHARSLLFNELSQGVSTIPTIQSLLLLSAQECSMGNSSQAWVYSGIAFRLIDHLGICFDGERYAGTVSLTDEDIEIRRRLFWSCYFWDKMISLYLGRSPTLKHTPASPPQLILDDSSEEEIWVPHGLVYAPGKEYPCALAHTTSCFMQMCQLSVIFNQILEHLYDPSQHTSEEEMQACLIREEASLQKWREELPHNLTIEANNLPVYAPPAHIVTLNCVYHTFRILLYRPFLSRRMISPDTVFQPNPKHVLECVTSSTAIIAIFDLFRRSFGEDHCTLSLTYCVYIAASIFLMQVQATPTDQQALRRLEFCVHSLAATSSANRVLGSAITLIRNATQKLGIEITVPETGAKWSSNNFPTMPIDPFNAESYGHDAYGSHLSADGVDFSQYEHLDPSSVGIAADLYEAVSSLEPISVRVGALDGFDPPI